MSLPLVDRGSERPLRLLDHLGFIVDTGHVKLCVLKQNFGDGTVSHADVEHAKRTVSALGEAAQCLGQDLMHVVEERPGETPQGIVVAELAGEAPLAEAIAAFRYYFSCSLLRSRCRVACLRREAHAPFCPKPLAMKRFLADLAEARPSLPYEE